MKMWGDMEVLCSSSHSHEQHQIVPPHSLAAVSPLREFLVATEWEVSWA